MSNSFDQVYIKKDGYPNLSDHKYALVEECPKNCNNLKRKIRKNICHTCFGSGYVFRDPDAGKQKFGNR